MQFTPPTYSTRRAGNITSAELLDFKLKHKPKKASIAQRAGLRYEKRVFVHLLSQLEGVAFQPAFRFSNGYKYDQYAIPDAMHIEHLGLITLFEVKLKHTADAWHQLRNLYEPILAKVYPSAHINVCEICRTYDPSVKVNDKVEFVEDLRAFTSAVNSNFGVYLWSGL